MVIVTNKRSGFRQGTCRYWLPHVSIVVRRWGDVIEAWGYFTGTLTLIWQPMRGNIVSSTTSSTISRRGLYALCCSTLASSVNASTTKSTINSCHCTVNTVSSPTSATYCSTMATHCLVLAAFVPVQGRYIVRLRAWHVLSGGEQLGEAQETLLLTLTVRVPGVALLRLTRFCTCVGGELGSCTLWMLIVHLLGKVRCEYLGLTRATCCSTCVGRVWGG